MTRATRPGREVRRWHPDVLTDAGHARVSRDPPGAGGGPVLHRASALGDKDTAPQDPLVPLGGLPAPDPPAPGGDPR